MAYIGAGDSDPAVLSEGPRRAEEVGGRGGREPRVGAAVDVAVTGG